MPLSPPCRGAVVTVTAGGTGYLGASFGWGAYEGGGYLIIDGGTYLAFTGLVATRDASVGTISIIGGANFQVDTVNPVDFNSIDTNANGLVKNNFLYMGTDI